MSKRLILILGMLSLFSGLEALGQSIALVGGKVYSITGEVIDNGVILIKAGKISAVGKGVRVPGDSQVIQAKGFILCPGFLAGSSLPALGEIRNFETISPDLLTLDRFDSFGDYAPLLAGGITCLYLETGQNRLVSGRGSVVKLSEAGKKPSVVKPEAGLNINFGKSVLLPPRIEIFPAPVRTENPIVPAKKQFPSSALGTFWVLAALFRFEPFSGDLAAYMNNISSSLEEAKNQKLSLFIRCQKAADILQAVELAKTVDMPLVILGAQEAHRLVNILKENKVSVWAEAYVRTGGLAYREELLPEKENLALENIPILIKGGIPVALYSDDESYLPDLFWICQYFRKYGISEQELLKTVTINPARMLGVDERVGSLEPGKDADILFFREETGKPLPRLEKVMIEGRIVYEKK